MLQGGRMNRTRILSISLLLFLLANSSYAFLEGECGSRNVDKSQWSVFVEIWNDFPYGRLPSRRLEIRFQPPSESEQSVESRTYFVSPTPRTSSWYQLRLWGVPRLTIDTFPDYVRRLRPYYPYRSTLDLVGNPTGLNPITNLDCQFFLF